MLKYLKGLSLLFFSFCFFNPAFSEDVTITTYYPSPFGSYRELRAARMAIGDNYTDGTAFTWETVNGDGGEVDWLADLIVEGNVGIGTPNPNSTLTVNGDCTISGKFNSGIKGNYGPVSSPGDVNYNTYTVNFPVAFSAPPMVFLQPRTNGVNRAILVADVQSVGTNSFIMRVSDNDFGRQSVNGSVDWIAIGT